MSIYESFFGFIKSAVGNNMDNHEEDVLKVKGGLSRAGYFKNIYDEPEPHGFITKEMDIGIRNFQKDKGLKIDGILLPRGETEHALRSHVKRISEKIEREELPSQLGNQRLIPGTNIIDKGVWEGETPYQNRFDFKPRDKSVPIPQIIPPNPTIDRPMTIPYPLDDKRFFRKYKDI